MEKVLYGLCQHLKFSTASSLPAAIQFKVKLYSYYFTYAIIQTDKMCSWDNIISTFITTTTSYNISI